jgi:cytoskeleton protein RodZ
VEKEQQQPAAVAENLIGKTLREAREAKGLTLIQVSDATRISKAYLQAVEEDAYQKIPGEVFVKGVLRGYGNFLGLDGTKAGGAVQDPGAGSCGRRKRLPSKIREATNVKITPTFKPNEDAPAEQEKILCCWVSWY